MRRRVNILTRDILDVIAGWPVRTQRGLLRRWKTRLSRIGLEFLEPLELCTLLDTMQKPRALLTRNTIRAVQYIP
ncbi:hypothetical protein WJX75_005933 [Coccomyxa subellipsoidea]|uniref:Uncharacterized protein n=1 Tax=Coccomyxa subellipsoidea TaxID=248742 RepID=A0ABR2YJJ3_9CHLO